MSHAIDFGELKQRVSIERAAEMLGVKLTKSGPQLRGPCPICKSGGDRAFVVTPAKGLYYCFGACGKGGDAITMAANVRGCSLREAAEFLAGKDGASSSTPKGDGSRSDSPQPPTEKGLRPLDYLQAAHEAVQALGVSPETCAHFGAGFAPKGIMRGRFAIPIHDRAGTLLAYCGRAVNDESPSLIFPNGFDPRGAIFNAHRIAEGDLILVRDPLQVLTAHESGIENVVAFLTESVTALQLEQLAALMDERKCEHLEMF
ncbi:MAG: CHC2 zinc finger domain-containing protein [Candidatus Binataceae bacterium]|jgi:DNA primase